MSRSWGERSPPARTRGQTEPIAALIAVVAVCLALSFYVGVLEASLPGRSDRAVDEAAVERVERTVAPAGVVRPTLVSTGPSAGPSGYETNVTVAVGDRRWTAGPPIPSSADAATSSVPVRLAPGTVRPGRLEVRVR